MNKALLLISFFLSMQTAFAGKWSGEAAGEYRYFFDEGDLIEDQNQFSVYGQVEYFHEWADGQQSLTITPFARVDSLDSERSHFDMRELFWNWVLDDWDVKIGFKKVFWGVAESEHVVDIINQTDFVENPDGEDKLGQPMFAISKVNDWGIVDLYILTGFRERTFAGVDGRLRPLIPILTDDAVYESSAEEARVDFALRWSHTIGDWDIGLAHFSGTSREPLLLPVATTSGGALLPRYPVIDQSSIDVQATIEAWLWKLEAYTRSGFGERYYKGVGGLEYSFYGIFESDADLGLIAEYQFDERAEEDSEFSDAMVLGLRLALNDTQSTELLVGYVDFSDNDANSYFIEASRRLNDNWSVSLEARGVGGLEDDDFGPAALYAVRNDDYFQAALEYYF